MSAAATSKQVIGRAAARASSLAERAAPEFVLLLQEAYREGNDVPPAVPAGSPLPRPIVERPPGGIRRDIGSVAERAGLHLVLCALDAEQQRRHDGCAGGSRHGDSFDAAARGSPGDRAAVRTPAARGAGGDGRRRTPAPARRGGCAWRPSRSIPRSRSRAAVRLRRGSARRRRCVEALTMAEADATTPTMVLGGDFNTWLGTARNRPSTSCAVRSGHSAPPEDGFDADGQHLARSARRARRTRLTSSSGRVPLCDSARTACPIASASDHYPLLTSSIIQ